MSERNKKVDPSKTISRREFLSGAGLVAAGAFGVASTSKLTAGLIQKESSDAVEWPAYEKLDVEQVRKLGHLGYYEGACSYGAFHAVVSSLGEKVGGAYVNFPTMLMKFGEGGVVGWGSLCGGLNGACAAIGLIAGEDYKPLVNELVAWYSNTPLPTDISNELAVNHEFLVSEYKSDQSLEQSVSNSTSCHVSVTNWCKASGFASGSSERSERCGRLTGDVAAYAVELLNAHADGAFEPALPLSEDTQTCRTCHSKGKEFDLGQWTRGKEECSSCHEPHEITAP